MNLLQGAYAELHRNGRTLSDVEWCGCDEFQISMDNFLRCADVDYEPNEHQVADDLMLVGHNFVLSISPATNRWIYSELPSPPVRVCVVDSLVKTEESERRRWTDNDFDASRFNRLRYMTEEGES